MVSFFRHGTPQALVVVQSKMGANNNTHVKCRKTHLTVCFVSISIEFLWVFVHMLQWKIFNQSHTVQIVEYAHQGLFVVRTKKKHETRTFFQKYQLICNKLRRKSHYSEDIVKRTLQMFHLPSKRWLFRWNFSFIVRSQVIWQVKMGIFSKFSLSLNAYQLNDTPYGQN